MQALAVGARAPESLATALPVGRTRVLAFVRGWTPEAEDPATLRQIRAHLRGLGAELIIHSSSGVWTFGADDALERSDRAVAEAVLLHGLRQRGDAVYVVDGGGFVRFAHTDSLAASLAGALEAAAQAMLARGVLFNRREWVATCLASSAALAVVAGCRSETKRDPQPAPPGAVPAELDLTLDINGKAHPLRVDPRTSLLDALREQLGLTGTKKGCDAGQCGACTVLADGVRVNACLTLAAAVEGKKITTIEGLANGTQLHPMQQAFVQHDALQCGYCTPGQIMSAVGCLSENHASTDAEIREQMSGNICRCGAYPNILAAIKTVKG